MHFGQEDHVRIYSTDGVLHRLRTAGFEVDLDPFAYSDEDRERFVLEADGGWDHGFLCRRGRMVAASG